MVTCLFEWRELWGLKLEGDGTIILYVHLHHGTKLTTCRREKPIYGFHCDAELQLPPLMHVYMCACMNNQRTSVIPRLLPYGRSLGMRLSKNHISLIKQACMWAGVCMHVQPVLQARPTFACRATSVCVVGRWEGRLG